MTGEIRLTICGLFWMALLALGDRRLYPEFAEWLSREREP